MTQDSRNNANLRSDKVQKKVGLKTFIVRIVH